MNIEYKNVHGISKKDKLLYRFVFIVNFLQSKQLAVF